MKLADEIAAAEAHLAALRRRAETATCAEIGHDWQLSGGRNAGCCDDCVCSASVYTCARCGCCDNGDPDAEQARAECTEDI